MEFVWDSSSPLSDVLGDTGVLATCATVWLLSFPKLEESRFLRSLKARHGKKTHMKMLQYKHYRRFYTTTVHVKYTNDLKSG